MKLKLALFLILLAACAPKREVVELIPGPQGPGGANGHSVVSQYLPAGELECASTGNRLDLYLDLDDSLSVTEGDLYQGSLVACDGLNGANGTDGVGTPGPQGDVGPAGSDGVGTPGPIGPQGLPGADGASGATITTYASSSCTHIADTVYYAKAGSNNPGIYTGSTCAPSTKAVELGSGESFWVSDNALAVDYGTDGFRVITFN